MSIHELSDEMLRDIRGLTTEQFEKYIEFNRILYTNKILYVKHNTTNTTYLAKSAFDTVILYQLVANPNSDMQNALKEFKNKGVFYEGDFLLSKSEIINDNTTYYAVYGRISIVEFVSEYSPISRSLYETSNKAQGTFLYANKPQNIMFFSGLNRLIAIYAGNFKLRSSVFTTISQNEAAELLEIVEVKKKEIVLAVQLAGDYIDIEHDLVFSRHKVKITFSPGRNHRDKASSKVKRETMAWEEYLVDIAAWYDIVITLN